LYISYLIFKYQINDTREITVSCTQLKAFRSNQVHPSLSC